MKNLCTAKHDERYWEIDALRGIAIVMMIFFHIIFDMTYYKVITINLETLPWRLFTYSIGTIFLILVGISLTLRYHKKHKNNTQQNLYLLFVTQGLRILGFGMLITIATWFFLKGNGTILFGVLHCIGVSILLAYPFIRHRVTPFTLGIICIILGVFLSRVHVEFPYLLWLGLRPKNFYTLDYFPLLPWFGVILLGICIGHTFYPQGIRKKQIRTVQTTSPVHALVFLGRHSLLIYLIHQIIIVGILMLLMTLQIL
ncbi:MAG: heparan-alpha-glucosaminide N-acetyltransferase [Candidatus Thermoplasmatota archaeon]